VVLAVLVAPVVLPITAIAIGHLNCHINSFNIHNISHGHDVVLLAREMERGRGGISIKPSKLLCTAIHVGRSAGSSTGGIDWNRTAAMACGKCAHRRMVYAQITTDAAGKMAALHP
jgi:hypothetical protein